MTNAYPSYKPSGIDWLGDIPAHWEMKKLKYLSTINQSRLLHKHHYQMDDEVVFLPMEKVSEDGQIDQKNRKKVKEALSGFTYFERGDVIIAKITPCFENGKGAYLGNLETSFGFGSTEFHTIKADKEISPEFLYLVTKSQRFMALGEASMTGSAGQKRVPSSFIEQYYIGLPPLAEQIAIAEYLDKQTAQIDDLVTQKWKLISLLQEERAGIINDAVTQGLNHRAPRKESGLPWLGKIPAHWGVKKLKYVANVRTGIALGGATDKTFKVEMPYIRVANVQDGYLNLDSIKTLEIEPDSIERYSLKYGDLLMNEGGDNDKLGRGCVWRGEVVGCLHQNHVFAVRMKVDYNSEWVNAVTLTNYARHYFMTRCKCPYPFR